MQITMRDLLIDPRHYPFAIDGANIRFVRMDREAFRRSIFLDQRIKPASPQSLRAPIAQLEVQRQREKQSPAETIWIFHIAHCGSTLLARAFDMIDGGVVLREPAVLRQLGVAHANGQPVEPVLALAHTMLARRFDECRTTIIKGNVPVNAIVTELTRLHPAAPVFLLYYPLAQYLAAILRSPDHRRWVNSITREIEPMIIRNAGPIDGASIACRAAALWLAQLRIFVELLKARPNGVSIEASMLFADSAHTLSAVFEHVRLDVAPDKLAAIVASDLFSTHAKKSGAPFDNDARQTREAKVMAELEPEIAEARAWTMARLGQYSLPETMPNALMGKAPRLL